MKGLIHGFLLNFATLGSAFAFQFDDVESLARDLAQKPYRGKEDGATLPKSLELMNYDQYRAIKNRPEGRLWQEEGLPFRLELLHSGYLFKRPVKLHEVSGENGEVSEIGFDPQRYDYADLIVDDDPKSWSSLTGYAGFRIQHPLNGGSEQWDEIGSFVGASYFRVLGQDQRYGLSARGLAINVANSGTLEEFPDFIAYWLVKPKPGDRGLTIYALLEGPSVTGAYEFQIVPGVSTEVDVRVSLFFRNQVASLGMAPLTSMFLYGENSRERPFRDWRPEVHDSDGLLVATRTGELVWRPLLNMEQIRFSAFEVENPRGFGLMQRDRNFTHYQDLDNPYHLTPSYWVECQGDWGKGKVRLIELPTPYETYDNIVAFFEPDEMPEAGEALSFSYVLKSTMHLEEGLSPERVVATRVGVDPIYGDTRRFVVDFDGPTLRSMDKTSAVYAVIDSGPNGYITENRCFKNEQTGGWRVAFKLDTDDHNQDPVELRCFLKLQPEGQTLTETWSYQWLPENKN
ncbi:glucan biosynthesis protein [Haloferula chungangensis]|uniref:Glucans biosynthesis protein G n=1 Tax=Haloferula chungangensis TaxID=1048331 RepID=A0ABW2LB81_9BACT